MKALTDTVPADWTSFLAPDEFRRASWKPYKGAVLGDHALRVLDPGALAERISHERLRMLLCPVSVNGERAEAERCLRVDDLLHGKMILLKRGKKSWHATHWSE